MQDSNIKYDFSDQVCIVTGGTRGIGREISKHFLNAGAKVIALYKSNHEKANAFKNDLGELSDRLTIESVDVSDYHACEEFFKKYSDTSIHVLVNNSGIRRDGLLLMMKEEQWDSVLHTNLKGTFNMTKFATAAMLKNRYGRIINMSSVAGVLGLPGQCNYSASKAGQIAFSKSLSKEVAKRGITINNIAPGFIETELIDDLPEAQVSEYKKQVPMKRFGSSQEVANTVLFLASKESSYITGATIEITGGL